MSDLVGKTFAGYEVLAKLGEGGMGSVFKARQPMLNRLVAIKTIAAHRAHEPGFVERFMHEAATAAKLNHPNIVQVYTGGEQAGTHYLVEEFVEGESLYERLAREGRMDPQEALAICVFVAEGLKHAWDEAQIIHRDIKPANIFLSAKGAVKVGDMGLAKSIGGETSAALTQSGTAVGTPFYMSPEQAHAEKTLDFRADIYSLGCTLYHLLSGKTPYEAGPEQSPMSIMIKQATAPPPMILQVLPGCPGPVVILLAKMLAKQPGARHQSYDELIADLRRVHDLLGQPKASAPISSSLHASKVANKKKTPLMIYGGVAAAAAVVVIGLLLWAPWKPVAPASLPANSENVGGASAPRPAATPTQTTADRGAEAPPTFQKPSEPVKPVEKTEVAKVEAKPVVPVTAPSPVSAPAKPTAKPADFAAEVASLTGGEQLKRVVAKLKELNPGFDGNTKERFESNQLVELTLSTEAINDLSPLRALKSLRDLRCAGSQDKRTLSDLSPLKGLLLTRLHCPFTEIRDLAPLAGAPLTSLNINFSQVTDLSPLKGMPLETLSIRGAPLTDLMPLAGLPLKELSCEAALTVTEGGKDALAAIKALQMINDEPVADFWKRVGLPEDPFVRATAKLPADQQAAAVLARLKELNPGFDPATARSKIEAGQVTELVAPTVAIKDITPLKALKGLKRLTLMPGVVNAKSELADFAPLKGLPLTFLACGNTQISDLTPLKGMPLTILSVDGTAVADLTPLEGMPLTLLWCNGTKASDLSPIKAARLQELRCDPAVANDNARLLRAMRTLVKINDLPAAQFWLRLATMPKPAAPSLQSSTTPSLQGGKTLTTSTSIELAWIPAGSFLMGSTAKEREWALGPEGKLDPKYMFESGEPKRTTIKNGFWLGRTEVTVGQWQKFVDATGYVTEAEKRGNANAPDPKTGQWGTVQGASWRNPNFGFPRKENHAVCCISWNDAVAFCEWLTETEKKAGKLPAGLVYRLPGEAEWEYACRGGKEGTKFWWGDAMDKGKGRLNGSGDVWGDPHKFVSPVDSFGSRGRNGFGLADMLGNVYEWCLDGFDPETAHAEPYKEKTSVRVLRGGSFYFPPGYFRCAHRNRHTPSSPYAGNGFRVCAGVGW